MRWDTVLKIDIKSTHCRIQLIDTESNDHTSVKKLILISPYFTFKLQCWIIFSWIHVRQRTSPSLSYLSPTEPFSSLRSIRNRVRQRPTLLTLKNPQIANLPARKCQARHLLIPPCRLTRCRRIYGTCWAAFLSHLGSGQIWHFLANLPKPRSFSNFSSLRNFCKMHLFWTPCNIAISHQNTHQNTTQKIWTMCKLQVLK